MIKLLSSVVRGRRERSEPMETSVDDITPVLRHTHLELSICLLLLVVVGLRGESTRSRIIVH